MNKFLAAALVVVATSGASSALASDGWQTISPAGKCGVGMPAPTMQIVFDDLTAVCDTQPGTGGYNFKTLGRAKPVYADKCVLRVGTEQTTFTKACKRIVTAVKKEGETLLVKATFMGKTSVYRLKKFAGNWGARRVN